MLILFVTIYSNLTGNSTRKGILLSIRTLRTINRLLPMPVFKVIGTNTGNAARLIPVKIRYIF